MPSLNKVLDRIRQRRDALQLTQADVAKAIGTNRVSYNRIENGEQAMTADELLAIAATLGLKISWLLDEDVDPASTEGERELIAYYRGTAPELKPSARAALKALHDIERAKGEGSTRGKKAE